jgi:hypothetical protein
MADKKCMLCGRPGVVSMASICFICMDEVCEAEERFGLDELERYANGRREERRDGKNPENVRDPH